jgi:hypothetical protein
MVGFMGCYAAINGLRLARHIVRSEPEASVLMINLELCSLHFQETQNLESVLSFLLQRSSGLFAEAHRRYPGVPIKAVLSTSDSWPHVGGVRFDVAEATPVYILELNQPLLGRMVAFHGPRKRSMPGASCVMRST